MKEEPAQPRALRVWMAVDTYCIGLLAGFPGILRVTRRAGGGTIGLGLFLSEGHERRRVGEIVLGHPQHDLVDLAAVLLGDLQVLERHRDALLADPQEAADADNRRFGRTAGIEYDVVDRADRLVVRPIDRSADQVRSHPLARALLGDEITFRGRHRLRVGRRRRLALRKSGRAHQTMSAVETTDVSATVSAWTPPD